MQRFLATTIAVAALLGTADSVRSGPVHNEAAALLVFSNVVTETYPGSGLEIESLVSVTNTSDDPVLLHFSYIDGAAGFTECYECDFQFPVVGRGSVTLAFHEEFGATLIESLGGTSLQILCPWRQGFVVVTAEDGSGITQYDDVLIGKQVIVDDGAGQSFAMPALSFQAVDGGDGDRWYDFDGSEFVRLPEVLATDFHAPNAASVSPAGFDAYLTLFTLFFERQFPPTTDCTISGRDADGSSFAASVQFGCWMQLELADIVPEFEYPNLGLGAGGDEHGWMEISCEVDSSSNGSVDAQGTVHGSLVQSAPFGTVLRRETSGPGLASSGGAWGRPLLQSGTEGDSARLILESPFGGE